MLKRPRCETNEGSETEVTVTSKRHAQAEESPGRAKKWKREEEAASNYETQDRKTVLRHGGALPREAESEGGR